MYASTLLSCRTSGRPPKREGARSPLFSTYRTEPCRLGPDGVSRSRAAWPRIPRIDPRNRHSQHLVKRAGAGQEFSGSSRLPSRNGLPPILATNAVSGSTMVPPWWDETTDSHSPLGGRYRGVGTGPGESLLPRTSENTPFPEGGSITSSLPSGYT
jgi:hypothetical protein